MIDIKHIMNNVVNNPDTVVFLNEREAAACLYRAKSLLKKEKAFIEIDEKVVFVGDTHGDFETTKSVIKNFFDKNCLVFLGDYIDREPFRWGAIYNIIYLLILKCCYPNKIYLLKGNHECNYIIPCYPYELENEIIQKYGSSSLHKKIVDVFKAMPLMLSSKNVFAAHGGILKEANIEKLKKVSKNDIKSIESIVWSDPEISPIARGIGDCFNEKDLNRFLKYINANVFIRGHDYNLNGFSIYNDKCLTIFSSRRYKNMGNNGILVAKAEKKISKVKDLIVKDFSSGHWKKYKVGRI